MLLGRGIGQRDAELGADELDDVGRIAVGGGIEGDAGDAGGSGILDEYGKPDCAVHVGIERRGVQAVRVVGALELADVGAGLRAVVAADGGGEVSGDDVLRGAEIPGAEEVRAAVLILDAARERAGKVVEIGAGDAGEREGPGDAGAIGEELRFQGVVVDLLHARVAVQGEARRQRRRPGPSSCTAAPCESTSSRHATRRWLS